MQSKIKNEVQFGQALNPLNNVAKVSSIDNLSDLKDVFTKSTSLKNCGMMGLWILALSGTFLVWQKYLGKVKSLVCFHKELMLLVTGLI